MHPRLHPLVALLPLALAAAALAADPSRFPDPSPDPRVGTPTDPGFDCAESDDEDAGEVPNCGSLFAEQFPLFGFAPDATEATALYLEGPRAPGSQVSGIAADLGWKRTTGSPEIVIAILDTGIRWQDPALHRKIFLNRGELPARPALECPAAPPGDPHDCDGDGAFTVDDYAGVAAVDADPNGNTLRDAQDLILLYSDGSDADANGYVDDIAGFDFLDVDNDPEDVSSYSAAEFHGTGRAREAGQETNEGAGGAGICPECRILPVRVWDTFVAPGDQYAAGTVFAADVGAKVQVVALGGLQNSKSAQAAARYAASLGMALMHVSSDLDTANHNYPTNYLESIFINGCIGDTDPGISEFNVPGIGTFLALFGLSNDPPLQTWFRSSNLTQYGAHAHVCTTAVTGSQATGQAGGAAGLVHSLGLALPGGPLSSNEVKQVLTQTAEDVLPLNTTGTGMPDPAQPGFDEHFGYGRVDLDAALAAVAAGAIPPEAAVEAPAWWAMLDPGSSGPITVDVLGHVAAPRSGLCSYRLEWAPGIEPLDGAFSVFAGPASCASVAGDLLGQLPLGTIADSIPGARTGTPPGDPNSYAFTVRLVVEDGALPANRGEDRKVYFAFHDPTLHPGWPRFTDTGGETSPVLYDLDGDGLLEIIDADSSGALHVLQHDGTPLPSWNGGSAWQLPPTHFYAAVAGSAGYTTGAVPPPTGGFRTPAVGDVDGDLEPELVVTTGDGRLYVLGPEAQVEQLLGVDTTLSEPADRSPTEHPKRGFLGAAVIADLDDDGPREIIAAALDGHIYVWSGVSGALRAGFPVRLADPAAPTFFGGEIIATPAVGDLDGDGKLEIVSGSNEAYAADGSPPSSFSGLKAAMQGLVTNLLSNAIGGSSRLHAIDRDGNLVPGWPVTLNGLLPDVLPFVGPNHAVALADLDGDGDDEVVASITTGELHVIEGDGSIEDVLASQVPVPGDPGQAGKIINFFEYPVIGDLDGLGGLDIVKGGLSAPAVVNLLLVGQNLPGAHVVQAWDSASPNAYRPGWPVTTDDYQLLSTPALADVDGSGTREVLVGTGLYRLHAYDTLGNEAAGFPKLAGGWIFGVPAIGDVDGDGLLELAAGTREGWRFLWDLPGAATPGATEWATEAHDECHTQNHGTDCRPPARVRNLSSSGGQLVFTAPGDDWDIGQAAAYELRSAGTPIETGAQWRVARTHPDHPSPEPAGTSEALSLPANHLRYVALLAVDEAGNRARIASVDTGPPLTGKRCGLLGVEPLLVLALLRLARRRRTQVGWLARRRRRP